MQISGSKFVKKVGQFSKRIYNSRKIASLLRSGMLPMAYVYP